MSDENLEDRGYVTTEPEDSNDPSKFGQVTESTKDAFKIELEKFFSYKTADVSSKIAEVPTIQKFALGADGNEQRLEQVVQMIMAYADTPDQLPMVAITVVSSRERKLGIGSGFVDRVQYPPSICGTVPGPYDLTDGWTLEFKTWPSGYEVNETTSIMEVASVLFADISSPVTTQELADAINKSQALYYHCDVTADDCLRISCGGPMAVTNPNYIEITDGDAAFLSALGFTVGQSDIYTNTDNPPKNRYGLAADMVVNIDVVTDDPNTRSELGDLVTNFFTFYMEKRRFQFIGRSYQSRDIDPEEWYHIIFQGQSNWTGEINTPRQGGGEGYNYIYANRCSIPVLTCDFIDRKLVTPPVFLDRDLIIYDETGEIPVGDHTQDNWLKRMNE